MNPSQNCFSLIKLSEGCVLHSYHDAKGVLTIGWGHTANVKEGQRISQAQADAMLAQDVAHFAEGVAHLLKVSVNQNEFDALVSFAYNLGLGCLAKSTLLTYVNTGQFTKAAAEFLKFVHAGKKVLPGLVKRRKAEMELFLKPVPKPVPKPVAKKQGFHTVVSGDTLSELAVHFHTTVAKIKKDNGLHSDLIRVGQKLKM